MKKRTIDKLLFLLKTIGIYPLQVSMILYYFKIKNNDFEITIRQIIKRYYRLQQLELRLVMQMEWCINHHIIAQYIEITLQCTEKKYLICSDAK